MWIFCKKSWSLVSNSCLRGIRQRILFLVLLILYPLDINGNENGSKLHRTMLFISLSVICAPKKTFPMRLRQIWPMKPCQIHSIIQWERTYCQSTAFFVQFYPFCSPLMSQQKAQHIKVGKCINFAKPNQVHTEYRIKKSL